MARLSYWVTTERGSVALRDGDNDIGRSADCDLVITDDERVSRRHARIVLDGGTAVVHDLDSANGTFVDGERIKSPRMLHGGEVIRVGTKHFQVGAGVSPPRQVADTDPEVPSKRSVRPSYEPVDTDISDLTPQVDTSSPSAFLRAAVGGRTTAGERLDEAVLVPMLEMVSDEVRETGTTEMRMAQRACLSALGLAVSTRRPEWIDYAVNLYSALGVPMPERVLDALEVAQWQVGGADPEALAAYATRLRDSVDPLDSPGQAARLRIEEAARIARNLSERR